MIVLFAIGCFVASVLLFRWALHSKIDAAPAGSIMLLGSVVLFLMGVFLLGVVVDSVLLQTRACW